MNRIGGLIFHALPGPTTWRLLVTRSNKYGRMYVVFTGDNADENYSLCRPALRFQNGK